MNMFDILLAKKLAGGGDIPEPILIEKNITANGDYLASADNADGFSKVSVNVQPTLISKNVIANGTYNASSDNADGYSSVVVNVASNYDITGDLVIEGGVASAGPISVVIPEGVTTLADSTFYQMKDLKSVSFPSTFTTLGGSCFSHSGIERITLPENIISVGSYVFNDCQALVDVDINGSALGVSMFYGCLNLEGIDLSDMAGTILPDSIFQSCQKLSSVVLKSGTTSINRSAFASCTALKSITIPDTVLTMGASVFSNSGLESIVIPNSVIAIGQSLFSSCSSLASADIGSGIVSLPNSTFAGCANLMSITLRKTSGVVSITSSSLNYVPANCDIYVPANLVDTYKASSQWSARADYIHAIPA